MSATGIPPPYEIKGLIDELRATVNTLLASLQDKERELCDRAGADPFAGLAPGVAGIYALRAGLIGCCGRSSALRR